MMDKLNLLALTDWKKYFFRWGIFGLIAGGLQPVYENLEAFWLMKLAQCLNGLFFGFVCAFAFTLLQNKFNAIRVKTKTYVFAFATWMAMKFIWDGLSVLF